MIHSCSRSIMVQIVVDLRLEPTKTASPPRLLESCHIHASLASQSLPFLSVCPEYMIIQVGKENSSAELHGYRRVATCVLNRASRAVQKNERFEKRNGGWLLLDMAYTLITTSMLVWCAVFSSSGDTMRIPIVVSRQSVARNKRQTHLRSHNKQGVPNSGSGEIKGHCDLVSRIQ